MVSDQMFGLKTKRMLLCDFLELVLRLNLVITWN